jgi:hypothetical protein
MATPEAPRDVESRLTQVEDAVQEFRFVHQVRVDAATNGMGILYAGQQRLEHMVMGFRAEVTAELETIKTEQARQGGLLAEILRRLPE